MADPHPLVAQLRFARSEFARGLDGVSDADGRIRLGPMNSLGWNAGHLAWQEQRYFLTVAQDRTPFPHIEQAFASGGPPSTPPLSEVVDAWRAITAAADPWLESATTDLLAERAVLGGRALRRTWGSLVLRTIYHYWFHAGENLAIRQQLGHRDLPEFVGALDDEAPYRPEAPA
jgi:DinB superfamily